MRLIQADCGEPTSGLEPPSCSLRVITQALQGCAGGCKCRIFKLFSLLRFAACCTVLRSRWYQSGINSPPCALTLLCKASGCSAVCGTSLDGPHSCHKRQMALTIKRFRTQAFETHGGAHPIPYAAKLRDGLKLSSVRYIHAVLHRPLEQAVRFNLIPFNPASRVDPPKIRQEEITPLDAEQACSFLHAGREDRFEALRNLIIMTGLRVGEALGLRW
jgi:hypothetical protein